MGENSSIFAIGKYHINTMEITKIFPIKNFCACTKLSLIDNFVNLQKECQFRGFFKETNCNNWGLKD